MNIFSNCIPNKLITVHDRDPSWMNKKIENKFNEKKLFVGPSIKNGRSHEHYLYLKSVSIQLSEVISKKEIRIP